MIDVLEGFEDWWNELDDRSYFITKARAREVWVAAHDKIVPDLVHIKSMKVDLPESVMDEYSEVAIMNNGARFSICLSDRGFLYVRLVDNSFSGNTSIMIKPVSGNGVELRPGR